MLPLPFQIYQLVGVSLESISLRVGLGRSVRLFSNVQKFIVLKLKSWIFLSCSLSIYIFKNNNENFFQCHWGYSEKFPFSNLQGKCKGITSRITTKRLCCRGFGKMSEVPFFSCIRFPLIYLLKSISSLLSLPFLIYDFQLHFL